MDTALAAMRDFLHAEFTREMAHDFEQLKPIPSTYVLKFLDCFHRIDRHKQPRLINSFVQNALGFFFPRTVAPHAYNNSPIYRDFLDYLMAIEVVEPWKYKGLHLMRMLINEFHRTGHPHVPQDVIHRIQAASQVHARDISYVVEQEFATRYDAKAIHQGNEKWLYEGRTATATIKIFVDYTVGHAQLRYGLMIDDPIRNLRLPVHSRTGIQQFSYEQLMGVAFTEWDLIHAGNLEESIALLCKLIDHVVALLQRIPSQYLAKL